MDGSISYLYSSIPLANVVAQSEQIALTTLFRSYRRLRELRRAVEYEQATEGRQPETTAAAVRSRLSSIGHEARRLVERPTLLYGRLYLPRSMLEALAVKRISPSLQLQVTAVSEALLPNGGTLLGMIQYDKSRYAIEGLASTDGGLLGVRGLYNFGGDASPAAAPTGPPAAAAAAAVSLDEPGGPGNAGERERERIYGRFSVGGEVYYGTLNKSGGVSVGARFATLPTYRGTPLTATLTINPLMGNIAAGYAVQAGRSCSLATKFDFNVYSYESNWAVGAELWSKRQLAGLVGAPGQQQAHDGLPQPPALLLPEGPARKERSFQAKLDWRLDDDAEPAAAAAQEVPPAKREPEHAADSDRDYQGVLKVRLDQTMKIGLLWEGRLKSLLFRLGSAVDLHKPDQPFRTVGLEIQFSS